MHVDDDLYLGPVLSNFQARSAGFIGPSPMARGIGPLGRLFAVDYVPVTLAANNICAAQAIAGAANAVVNGALATAGVAAITDPFGRALQFVSTNVGDTTQTVTVTGTDFLGNVMTARITLNGVTIVNGTKAFKTITQVAVSAVMVGNLTVGTNDKLGLPVVLTTANLIANAGWNSALAKDAGTFVAADATIPATNLTGDTRGTYQPSSATDGAKRLTLLLILQDIHVAPSALSYSTATRTGAFGVTPV